MPDRVLTIYGDYQEQYCLGCGETVSVHEKRLGSCYCTACGLRTVSLRSFIEELRQRGETAVSGYRQEIHDAEQPLARALRFPRGDDITLPAEECATGGDTVVSLAQMAEEYIANLEHENQQLRGFLECYAVTRRNGHGYWHTCLVCGKTNLNALRHDDTCIVGRPLPFPCR